MRQQTLQIINDLKQSNQDFEWYETTDEILSVIDFDYTSNKYRNETGYSVLDIGCGRGKFDEYFTRKTKIEEEKARREGQYYNGRKRYDNYCVIEKSQILLQNLPDYSIFLGGDFWETSIVDKKVDLIFCNPPYTEYERWSERIILEGNSELIYLVIPDRWEKSEKIQEALKRTDSKATVMGSFDFLNAERQARAYVNVVKIKRNFHYSDKTPFDLMFDELFKVEEHKQTEEQKSESIKNQLVEGSDKIKTLVKLYDAEMQQLLNSYQNVCSIPIEVLKDCNITKEALKSSLSEKIKGLKVLYWKQIFDNLDEIKSRLTQSSRQKLFKKFYIVNTVDFSEQNIRSVLIFILKNTKDYFEEQLVDMFKLLSEEKNVKPYKSNQRLFQKDGWRWTSWDKKDYVLDYRMVVEKSYWIENYERWHFERGVLDSKGKEAIEDFCVIANNLGFETDKKETAHAFGKKYYYYLKNGDILFEYKVYKKGTIHFKLNVEFSKALNVEASRILGWIRNKEDIKKEFPPEMAQDSEKYFKQNVSLIENKGLLLLT